MKNNIEFEISQLRQDKINYAAESVAIGITALVISSLISLVASFGFIPEIYLFYFNILVFVFAIGYTIYSLIGNIKRQKKIRQLEK